MTKAQEAEKQAAIERLRGWLKPGMTVHTVLKHRSASGMYRAIDVLLLAPRSRRPGDVDVVWLSYNVAQAGIGRWDDKREAVGVSGAGTDMGFHIVYELAYTLFGKGWKCAGKNCPSNDHSNGLREYDRGITHSDGGYALHHKWL